MANGWWERIGAGRDPSTGRFVPPTEDPFLGRLTTQSLTEQILIQVRAATGAAIGDQAYERLRAGLYEWARVMGQEEADRQPLEEMNARIAEKVQEAVIKAYQGAQNRGKRLPSYRWADQGKMRRYSNKQMLRALESPEFINSDYKGIRFPDTKHLDNAAKQWYRLNFGAAPMSTSPVNQPNMKFGEYQTRTSVSFNGFKPSKKFNVPSTVGGRARGVWSRNFMSKSPAFISKQDPDQTIFSKAAGKKMKRGYTGATGGNGRSALYVVPQGAFGLLGFEARTSRGIVGQRFIDAGATYLNTHYGQELSKLLNEWGRKANAAGKAVAEKPTGVKIVSAQGRTENIKAYGSGAAANEIPTTYEQAAQYASYAEFAAAGGDLADESFKTYEVKKLLRQWGEA